MLTSLCKKGGANHEYNPKQRLMNVFLSALMGTMMLPVHEIAAIAVLTENTTGSEEGYDYELGNVEVQYLAAKN